MGISGINASNGTDTGGDETRATRRVRCSHELVEAVAHRGCDMGHLGAGALTSTLSGTSVPAEEQANRAVPNILVTGERPIQVQPGGARSEEGERQHGGGAPVLDTSVSSPWPTCPVVTEPVLMERVPKEAIVLEVRGQHKAEVKIKQAVAITEEISRAPVGNNNHRIWRRQAEPMKKARGRWSREADRQNEASCDVAGHPVWERGSTPKPSMPKTTIAKSDSFRWVIRPEGDMSAGEIYPDGSALDGPNPELLRCGWSFVVTCLATGKVIASAMGVSPAVDH